MNDISLYEKIPEIENSYPIKIRMYEADTLLPHWHEHWTAAQTSGVTPKALRCKAAKRRL